MSYGCSADVVKFISHNVFEGDVSDAIQDTQTLLSGPEIYLAGEFVWQDPNTKYSKLVVNGWEYEGSGNIGKNNRLWAERWTKVAGDHDSNGVRHSSNKTIYLLNESQYSVVGGIEMAVIANDKELIKEFCKDNELDIRFGIKKDDAAQHWS